MKYCPPSEQHPFRMRLLQDYTVSMSLFIYHQLSWNSFYHATLQIIIKESEVLECVYLVKLIVRIALIILFPTRHKRKYTLYFSNPCYC